MVVLIECWSVSSFAVIFCWAIVVFLFLFLRCCERVAQACNFVFLGINFLTMYHPIFVANSILHCLIFYLLSIQNLNVKCS